MSQQTQESPVQKPSGIENEIPSREELIASAIRSATAWHFMNNSYSATAGVFLGAIPAGQGLMVDISSARLVLVETYIRAEMVHDGRWLITPEQALAAYARAMGDRAGGMLITCDDPDVVTVTTYL